MFLNIKTWFAKPVQHPWRWFIGLYIASLLAYGFVEFILHFLAQQLG